MRHRSLSITLLLAAACGEPATTDDAGADADAARPVSDDGDPAYVFDEDVIRTYDLTVAPDDWDWLNANARLEEYVPADLRIDGTVYPQIAIRYKGGYGTLLSCFDSQGNRTCDKLSIKLKFNEYVPGGRFHGLKRLNLHGMESDPTRMHDAIAYRLFRDSGVFAPRTAYARVIVNGELIGLYVAVEAIDGVFTRSRFPDGGEGNLYKEVWPIHTDTAPYLGALETNEDQNPSVDKMVRFAQDLAAATDGSFESVATAWTDVDMLMTYMAVARLIDHWDDIVAWYCVDGPCFNHNYYWYESTAEDRLWLLPWDLDHTFEEPSPIRTYYGMPDWDEAPSSCTPIPIFLGITGQPPACDDLIRRMSTVLWDRYASSSQTLLAGDFSPAAMTARIDRLESLIAETVADDPNGVTPQEWATAVADLRNAVAAKRSYIQAKTGP